MPLRAKLPTAVAAVLALIVWGLLPPRTLRTAPPPASTARGAFHIHSVRSDGSGTIDEIASAAASAGLQFIILTDHGDGTRPPQEPAYVHGVLVIDGVEVNTTAGHFAAVGLARSPYPLAGTADDVIEDVRRLGGFGFAAHPGSPRPSLSWTDWSAPIDGLEWVNADSEWRDEGRLPIARALLTYLIRPPQSMVTLLDRPAQVLQQWDALASTRRVLGIAGADAHARLGFRQRTDPDVSSIHLPLPAYAASFRAFSNHVELDAPLTNDAATDATSVLSAMRRGHMYSVIDGLATPGALTFTAQSGRASATMGEDIAIQGDVLLHAEAAAPPGTTLVLFKNGEKVHEVTRGPLEMNGGRDVAEYRIEAYAPNAPGSPSVPWMVSNPIYAGFTRSTAAPVSPPPTARIPARITEAAAEKGPVDASQVTMATPADAIDRTYAGEPGIAWTWALGGGAAAGQFAAVPIPVSGGLDAFDRVQFRVSASAPMRAWVQLRAPTGNTERWGATFYADRTPRIVDVPFSTFRSIGVTTVPRPPLDRVQFLLFVVDTLNTLPGTKGRLTIGDVAFVK